MLLIALKRCVCHTQIRQFATLHTYNRIQVKRQMMRHWTELKDSNLASPNITIQRFFITNPNEDKDEYYLPQLMWEKRVYSSFLTRIILSYWAVRLNIDNEFRLKEFIAGAKQAISVVSDALAQQKFEVLDGIVRKRTVKVLKHRINLLSPTQRELVAIDPEYLKCTPQNILIRKRKDTRDDIVEVTVRGVYIKCSEDMLMDTKFAYISYIFERRYTRGIGGSWIIKTVNHFTKYEM